MAIHGQSTVGRDNSKCVVFWVESSILAVFLFRVSSPVFCSFAQRASILHRTFATSDIRWLPELAARAYMHAQCFRVFIYISYVLRAVSLNQAIRYIPSLPLSVTASMSISSKYLCHKVIKYLLHVKVVVFFQLWLLVENDAVLSGSLPQLDFEKSCVICFKIIYCIKGIC